MTQELSPQKKSKMMALYFKGNSQSQVGDKLKINQATVSLHVAKFEALVEQYGLETAGKEYGVMNQVKALHSLAAELNAASQTVEEAKVGLKMSTIFEECGVKQEDYPDLIQACNKMKDEDTAKAAVELNQLESATGKTWKQIVAQAVGAHHDLEQTQVQIASMTAKLKTSKEQLAAANNQRTLADQNLAAHLKKVDAERKQADQELAVHMKQVGVDMKRLALMEDLAITLKEGSVHDTNLGQYIKRQKGLNQAGISLDNFTAIVKQAKVMTVDDGGKALAEKLAGLGGLDAAIEVGQNKLTLLTQQTDGLEEKAKLKAKIETDIAKLKAERAENESVVAELVATEKKLAKTKQDVTGLLDKQAALITDILQKQEHRGQLDGEIVDKQHRVADLSDLEAKRSAVSATLAELEAKRKLEVVEREIFESFLGIISSSLSAEAIQKFLAEAPQLIAFAKTKQYSPELLRNVMIKLLGGGTLEILRCSSCKARFYVDRPPGNFNMVHTCPACRSILVETDLTGTEIIKKALAALTPRAIVATQVIKLKGAAQKDLEQP